ncbi:MAG TPA: aminotransferase class V-fold PLP-dependent enzyme [Casimicrobiaceae bacterium]|nr:aminotransferase class V-fold PLP-dependent enzyme [Casimicrobiaceae bacterium]
MNDSTTTSSGSEIATAIASLGARRLDEALLREHVTPLFARVLGEYRPRIYLANHSLGRPLDAMAADVQEGLGAWYAHLGAAWDAWSDEMTAFRTRVARLINAPRADCVVPKTSAGQGLRAILNSYDSIPRVVATRGEFDSLDVILREYARRGRIDLAMVEARASGDFDTGDILAAIGSRADLVVVSEVVFNTGQRLADLDALVSATHRAGGRILVDIYHSVGVLPIDVQALDADFAVGGSYKYLRGGPGACYLYLHPRHLDGSLRTLDIGWFAKRSPQAYERPDPPQWGEGGDAFLESTPPVLMCYQARAGQLLTLGLGPHRLRAYSLEQLRLLRGLLAEHAVPARGGDDAHGAFLAVEHPHAVAVATALRERQIVVDARGPYLRLCPDILTTSDEMQLAARELGALLRSIGR